MNLLHPQRLRVGAFTLIELLVVISIIVLMIAILLPALAKARDTAKAVACAAKLQQLGLAVNMYADDNDELLLENDYSDPSTTFFYSRISPYLGVQRSNKTSVHFRCPSGPAIARYGEGLHYTWFANDYGLIYRRSNERRVQISNPSARAIFIDYTNSVEAARVYHGQFNSRIVTHASIIRRHDGGINAVYLDGHVTRLADPVWRDLVTY